MKKLILAAIVLGLSAQVNAASQNLVKNGSFEKPNLSDGTWDIFYDNSDVKGWKLGDNGVEIRDSVAGEAYHKKQFAELDTNFNSSIRQNLKTKEGKGYKLSFAYSPRMKQLLGTNGIEVFWDKKLLTTLTGSGAGATGNVWTVFDFMVAGGTSKQGRRTMLEFKAIGTSESYGGSLDAVSVSAVPIPAAAFLFAPALLGFMGLRRKAKISVA